MNTATQILSALKDKFNELMAAPLPVDPVAPVMPTEPVLEVKKLKDGTEITATSFDPGGVATVAGAPAPTGEHTLEDGTTLVIGEGGVISEVREIETVTTPEDLKSMFQKFAIGTPEERLQNLETVAKALFENVYGWELREASQKAIKDSAMVAYQTFSKEQEVAAQTKVNELQSKVDAQTQIIKELFEAVKVLAETPTAAPDKVVVTPNNFKAVAPKTDWSALAKQLI